MTILRYRELMEESDRKLDWSFVMFSFHSLSCYVFSYFVVSFDSLLDQSELLTLDYHNHFQYTDDYEHKASCKFFENIGLINNFNYNYLLV